MDICDMKQLRLAAQKKGGRKGARLVNLLEKIDPSFDVLLPYYPMLREYDDAAIACENARKWRVANAERPAIIRRRLAGETLRSIANRYGVKPEKVERIVARDRMRLAIEFRTSCI